MNIINNVRSIRAIGLFILIFGMASLLCYRQFIITKENSFQADERTANFLASVIMEHQRATLGVLQSYASRPLFVDAVKKKDPDAAYRHLAGLKSNHEIDLTFVTDKDGVLWVNYPVFPEALGKNLSYRDWYKGVSRDWKPYISTVFKIIVADQPLAVAVSVPVFNEQENVIGILSNSQRLDFLSEIVGNVGLLPDSDLTVIDRAGSVLYSNRYDYRETIAEYPFFLNLQMALKEKARQIEVTDPRAGDEKSYLTIAPVEGVGWTVIVARSNGSILSAEYRYFVEILIASLLLFLLSNLLSNYLSKRSALKDTEKLLSIERDALDKEKRYRLLLENIQMIALGLDVNGAVTFANPYLLQLTGYTSDEILGKNWFDHYIPEMEKINARESQQATIADASYSHYENAILMKNGAERLISWSSTPVHDKEGLVIGTMSLGVDITERRQSEEKLKIAYSRLERMSSSNVVGVALADAQGGLLEVNDYYLDVLGFTRMEFETGQIRWDERTPSEHLVADLKAIEELRERGICTPYEKEYVRKDGSRIWVLIADALVPGPDENILALVVDINDRKRAEEALQRLNESLEQRIQTRTNELEAANKELEAFSYSVSHDLRAPLRGIDGWSLALLEDYGDQLDEQAHQYLHRVRMETQQMGRLIDDLLKLSRLTRTEMRKMQVDLTAEASSIASRLQTENPGRRIEFAIQPDLKGTGDPALFSIVLTNLLDNAVKFTGPCPEARIEFGMTQMDGSRVFFVSDNGAGFDMSYAQKLFGAFQRLHKSSQFPGTGIGLTTVQRIIHRHGGRVWADAHVGKGATFYFTLKEGT